MFGSRDVSSQWTQVLVGFSVDTLTPLRNSSLWSLNIMNRLIFQLVLQFTELTCRGRKTLG